MNPDQRHITMTLADLDQRLRDAYTTGRFHAEAGYDDPAWIYPLLAIIPFTGRRTCDHCGRLFVPRNRSDERYCRELAPGEGPGGRTCQQVGPQAKYLARLTGVRAVYRRSYKRLDNYARRGQLGREELDRWREAARELLVEAEREQWEPGAFEERLAALIGPARNFAPNDA